MSEFSTEEYLSRKPLLSTEKKIEFGCIFSPKILPILYPGLTTNFYPYSEISLGDAHPSFFMNNCISNMAPKINNNRVNNNEDHEFTHIKPCSEFMKKFSVNGNTILIIKTYPVTIISKDADQSYFYVATDENTNFEAWYSKEDLHNSWVNSSEEEFIEWLSSDSSFNVLEVLKDTFPNNNNAVSIKEYARPIKFQGGEILFVNMCAPFNWFHNSSCIFFTHAKHKFAKAVCNVNIPRYVCDGRLGSPIFAKKSSEIFDMIAEYVYRHIGFDPELYKYEEIFYPGFSGIPSGELLEQDDYVEHFIQLQEIRKKVRK